MFCSHSNLTAPIPIFSTLISLPTQPLNLNVLPINPHRVYLLPNHFWSEAFPECGLPTRGHIIQESWLSSSHYKMPVSPQIVVRFVSSLSIYVGILSDSSSWKSCAFCHNFCEFIDVSIKKNASVIMEVS